MPTISINCSLLTSFFNNRISNSRVPNYEFYNSDGKINETILKVKLLFSFVTRHSLIVIRLLLHRQLRISAYCVVRTAYFYLIQHLDVTPQAKFAAKLVLDLSEQEGPQL